MQEIVSALTSPLFWFSTLLMALLVNLLSAYVKPLVDKGMSRINSTWRNRSEAAAAKFQESVEYLIHHPHTLAQASEQEFRSRLTAIMFLLLAVVIVLIMTYVAVIDVRTVAAGINRDWSIPKSYILKALNLFALGFMVFVIMNLKDAMRLSALIRAARDALDRIDSEDHQEVMQRG